VWSPQAIRDAAYVHLHSYDGWHDGKAHWARPLYYDGADARWQTIDVYDMHNADMHSQSRTQYRTEHKTKFEVVWIRCPELSPTRGSDAARAVSRLRLEYPTPCPWAVASVAVGRMAWGCVSNKKRK
jgi:hypothetical protein